MFKSLMVVLSLVSGLFLAAASVQAQGSGAYLEITLKIENDNRGAAVGVYEKYKQPFLDGIGGAQSKELLVRDDDVQVLHGFASTDAAHAYLKSDLFNKDVVGELGPLLAADPDVRIYMTH